MRIIRGKFGRRRFDVPTNISARPTTDFARENIFNVLENMVDFDGLKKRRLIGGSCTYLQNCDWRTVNTLEQEALVPRIRPVQVGEHSLDLELQPRSFSVYRLH